MTLAIGWLGAYGGWGIYAMVGISLRWLEGVGWGTYEGLKMVVGRVFFWQKLRFSNWRKWDFLRG